MVKVCLLVQAEQPVFIEFHADWCGPCKLIDPLLKQIDEEYAEKLKVVKIDCDKNNDLVEKYEVCAHPLAATPQLEFALTVRTMGVSQTHSTACALNHM